MNTTTEARIRQLIEDRLVALEGEDRLGADGQATVELDQQAVGRLSRMDALQRQAMSKAGNTRRHAERKRLIAALERMEAGEFGECEDCGEPIATGRLEVDPAALKCIDCVKG